MPESPDSLVRVEYITPLPYDEMSELYNSALHTDMKTIAPSPYGDMDTWYSPSTAALMRRPPWAVIAIPEGMLAALKDLALLAQLRPLPDSTITNDPAAAWLDARIADEIVKASKDPNTVEIFARLSECSMKRAAAGTVAPFTRPLQIVRAIIDDPRIQAWFVRHAVAATTLYLMDFDSTVCVDREYRVFVHKGVVTGVSQYRWWTSDRVLALPAARRVAARIVRFVESQLLRGALGDPHATLVADVIAEDGDDDDHDDAGDRASSDRGGAHLIEINRFGGHTGCGSGLFHWKRDEDVLYGDGAGGTLVRLLAA